jgi:hypothetical protein
MTQKQKLKEIATVLRWCRLHPSPKAKACIDAMYTEAAKSLALATALREADSQQEPNSAQIKNNHAKKRRLTAREWSDVFKARCRSKRGEQLSDEERKLVNAAFASDEKRYGEMELDVFDATVPFGSMARSKRTGAR